MNNRYVMRRIENMDICDPVLIKIYTVVDPLQAWLCIRVDINKYYCVSGSAEHPDLIVNIR